MSRIALALAAMLLAGGPPALAAPAKAKPAAAAKPAQPAQSAAAGPFNARDPASLIGLVATMNAKAEIMRATENEVFLKVTTPAFAFNVQYVDCDARGKNCQAVAFSSSSTQRKSTLAQLNSFNQTSITCRVYEDRQGLPHVMYATLLAPTDTRDVMRTHIGVWQGCLSTFGLFLSDPIGYLASAP